MFSRSLVLKVSGVPLVERTVRRSRLFRRLVSRFVAGETLEQCLKVAEESCSAGFLTSLDFLGENVKTEAEANEATAMYIRMVDAIAASPCRERTNISIKLTQCGLDQGDAFCEANYRKVVEAAARLDIFVRVDMEASAYTERTIRMVERVFRDFSNTGTVLQAYLYRTPQDVEAMIALGARMRIVKGAYLEPASVAIPKKSKVDEAYIELAKRVLVAGNYPAIASHDERIVDAIREFVAEAQIEPSRFEFQMIFGVRRDLQESLRNQGYNVRVYIPFGDSWYPYFSRRLAERPANLFFILKALFKG